MGILNLCMSTMSWACGQAHMAPFLLCVSFIHSGPCLICYCYESHKESLVWLKVTTEVSNLFTGLRYEPGHLWVVSPPEH